jgi:hypothetical protein
MAGSAPVQQTVADATNTVTSAAVESPDNVGRFGMSSMSGASSSGYVQSGDGVRSRRGLIANSSSPCRMRRWVSSMKTVTSCRRGVGRASCAVWRP